MTEVLAGDDALTGLIEDGTIAFSDLELHTVIGKGQFGEVYKALLLGTDVCVKRMFNAENQDAIKYIAREIKVLKSVNHPNVLQFIGVCKHDADIYLVTEYMPSGDLRKLLKKTSIELKWSVRIKIALDIAKALAFLHSRNIIHRDLKSKNLLVDNTGKEIKIKICDFGLARSQVMSRQQRAMTMCGTDEWMAPEVILGMDYDTHCDIFSYGIVLCEIITRRKPNQDTFARSPQMAFGLDYEELRSLTPPECPKSFLQLTIDCAEYEPELRPPMKDVVRRLKEIEEEVRKREEEEEENLKNNNNNNNNNNLTATTTTTTTTTTTSTSTKNSSTLDLDAINNHLPKSKRMTTAQLQDMFVQEMNKNQNQRLTKLIERATHDVYPDTEWCHTILLTLPIYAKPIEVLKKLIDRFKGDDWSQELKSNQKLGKIVRLRVINLLRIWLDNYFSDFLNNSEMCVCLNEFIEKEIIECGLVNAAQALKQSFELRKDHYKKLNANSANTAISSNIGKALVVNRASSILDFKPIDIAEALTLSTFDLYKNVSGRDIIQYSLKSSDYKSLKTLLEKSSKISCWVASDILQTNDLNKRQKIIMFFLSVGTICMSHQNFITALDIVYGLTSPPIARLKKSMNLGKSEMGQYKSLCVLKEPVIMEKILQSPFKPPRIPPLDIYLKQVQSINNNQLSKEGEEVNTENIRLIGNVVHQIQSGQILGYQFERKEIYQNFIESITPVPEAKMMELSLSLEKD